MPYAYVDAEVALEYNGIKVYHVYKDDCLDYGRRFFWYGLSPDCYEGGPDTFDVRDLAHQMGIGPSWNTPEEVIRLAIDKGILTQEGVKS
ncbi:hypothetical protein MTAT_19530 [Moorella thermoacetica]|uniref:Uncharacterized protein n=1 Tax=Neomoorella thermoacetica TaxID=1525 RepID=A0AAC9HIP4_NEOTH|nr:hypothetical protein [Moorella thermoacetica]AOQ24610.1 hypothetical protein Maut_02180 [Moorella thermoacetica]TYL12711.1 hypothetical protein MTAT_19530 [Moorella thermoacetica]